jgi:hypothetical protein
MMSKISERLYGMRDELMELAKETPRRGEQREHERRLFDLATFAVEVLANYVAKQ